MFRPAVVAPTYNNERTLGEILRRLSESGFTVIAVNDGSTDDTAQVLTEWQNGARADERVVLAHPFNCGKAAALQTGFAAAIEAGFTHIVTIDTDGQLLPDDVQPMLDVARASLRALVVGVRDVSADEYPARSRLGRRFSNLMVRLESGLRVCDSQCGLRVYPAALLRAVKCRAAYFGFETEVITRAGWAGFEVVGTPVSCRYFPQGQRVSHFKPWRDSLRALGMHAGLLLRALARRPSAEYGGLRELLEWVNPMRAWRQIRADGVGRSDCAMGLALGVFVANLPVYGFQTVLCLCAARRFRLHPLPLVIGSHVSTPPLGPLLVVGAVAVGHVLLRGELPALSHYDIAHRGVTATVGPILLEWVIGGLIIGIAMAGAVFAAASLVLRFAFASDASSARMARATGDVD